MNYTKYTVEDFVLDRNFNQWVTDPDPKNDAFWEIWQYQNPEKISLLQEARSIILDLRKMEGAHDALPETRVDALWSAIQAETGLAAGTEVIPIVRKSYLKAAAITFFLMCAAATGWWAIAQFGQLHHTTNYGETKKVTLPDGSVVILNANSHIWYSRSWTDDHVRTVSLEGEAYFDVVRSPQGCHPTFVVSTEDLKVEVLGTQFNVLRRDAKTLVTLQEGKVSLDIPGTTEPKIVMNPGDQIEFSSITQKAIRKTVKPENISSWTNNYWILDNTALLDVAKRIETIYGKIVVILEPSLATETISGVLPARNFESMLDILATLYDVKITVKDDKIMIEK